jgi:VIT1/CCC1 family predicted Fe2+/Mn2+ transporter
VGDADARGAADVAGWREEVQSAHLYRVLAGVERAPDRALLFRRLADEAMSQAAVWKERARSAGTPLPEPFRPDLRTRTVAWLLRRLGPRPLRPVLAAMKVRGLSVYDGLLLPGRRSHTPGAEASRHRAVRSGGNLRAAVFGANDGLVSNASLILGVAGATNDAATIVLSGTAGLLAGAFSMAAGEYVSVRSQREMYEYQIGLERRELEHYPEEEAEELALIYAARGMPADDARRLADGIVRDPEHALDTLAREELGLDPDQLGAPWGAALFSFVSFASGALLPLLPFLAAAALAPAGARGGAAGPLALAIAVTAAGLFGVGAALSLFTGRAALRGGLRMLAIGGAAGGLTFALGSLLGVALG